MPVGEATSPDRMTSMERPCPRTLKKQGDKLSKRCSQAMKDVGLE